MKSALFTSVLAGLTLLTGTVYADCRPLYVEQIKALDGRMNPGRGTVAANAVGALTVPLTAALIGVTVAPAALIATPAIGLGAGTYLFALSQKKRSYQKVNRVLIEAEKGSGPMLEHFFKQIGADDEGLRSKIRDELVHGNAKDAFCAPKGPLSKIKLMKYGQLKRLAKETLSARQ